MKNGTLNLAAVLDDELKQNEVDSNSQQIMLLDGALSLEELADSILEEKGFLGHDSGIYTQAQLDRKIRLEDDRLPDIEEAGLADDVVDYLCQTQIDELVSVSNLTAIQEICFRLYVSGQCCRDIAATLCIKHNIIANHLRAAKRRVQRACKLGKYAGWYEVYLSEVNRPVYRSCNSSK